MKRKLLFFIMYTLVYGNIFAMNGGGYQDDQTTNSNKKILSFSERQRLQKLVNKYSTPVDEVDSALVRDEESEVEGEKYSAQPDEEVLHGLPAALDKQAKKLLAEIKAKEKHSLREQETPQDLETASPCYQEELTKFFQAHE